MPCPTCRHTLHNIGLESEKTFWCPRCGTLLTYTGDREVSSAPFLVKHVRDGEMSSIRTTTDGKTLQYAVVARAWVAACEAVGLKAIGS